MNQALAAAIRVVLVEPTHPGNIGAVARAMKTMGLSRLVLVQPAKLPNAEAIAMAAGADDVLDAAVVCGSLPEALAGCGFVAGTSARPRHLDWPRLDPRACAVAAVREAVRAPVALVFGREHAGLTNAELERCHAMVRIPARDGFSSLNLAAAVQVLAYEIRVALDAGDASGPGDVGAEERAPAEAMDQLYAHLEQALRDIGYLDPARPRLLVRRLRRLLQRARPYRSEVDILRGILAAAQRAAGKR